MGVFLGLLALGIATLGLVHTVQSSEENKKNQLQGQYNQAATDLSMMKNEYDLISLVDLPDAQSKLDDVDLYLNEWDSIYSAQVGEAELEISTYDDFLNSWQGMYQEQTASAYETGRSNFNSLLANWSDAEVIAADRGASGSMSLVASQEKNRVERYVGSDFSLEGDDGLFGMSYQNLRVGLNNQRRQAEDTLGILNTNLDLLSTSLESDKAAALKQQENLLGTIDYHNTRKDRLETEIADKQALMQKLKKEGGF